MAFHSLFHTLLQKAAKGRFRDVLAAAARERLEPASTEQPIEGTRPCHLGFVFALGIESGCLEDLLDGMVTIRGSGFVVREGGLRSRRTVVILSGPGTKNAATATEVLLDGHHPARVISAGFAGALRPQMRRNDILVADCLRRAAREDLPVELPDGLTAMLSQQGVHRGALLTVDHAVRLPGDKRDLFDRYGAWGVDMEAYAVADACRRRNVAFSSVRVIGDASDETLPPDVEHLLAQTSAVARAGAALGAVWRRPASAKDLYQLRENALVASGHLAKFLAACDFA